MIIFWSKQKNLIVKYSANDRTIAPQIHFDHTSNVQEMSTVIIEHYSRNNE